MFWAVTIAQKDTKKRRKKPIQDQSLVCKNYLLSFAGSRDHKQNSRTLPVLSLLSTSFNYANTSLCRGSAGGSHGEAEL